MVTRALYKSRPRLAAACSTRPEPPADQALQLNQSLMNFGTPFSPTRVAGARRQAVVNDVIGDRHLADEVLDFLNLLAGQNRGDFVGRDAGRAARRFPSSSLNFG